MHDEAADVVEGWLMPMMDVMIAWQAWKRMGMYHELKSIIGE